jgi:hypothetical protein
MLDALTAIDRQLESAAQPLARAEADLVIAALGQDVFGGNALARLTGRYPGCATARALSGVASGSASGSASRSASASGSGSEAEARVAALLEKRREQLTQIRGALRIRAMLEVWLFVHVPLTIALIAALTAHVISVFYYW